MMTAALLFVSCKKAINNFSTEEQPQAKMKLVLAKMAANASDPNDKNALESAKVFVNLEGLNMSIIGAAVPNRFTGKRILVSFTEEHFEHTDVDQLASEGLTDFIRALKISISQKAPNAERSTEK